MAIKSADVNTTQQVILSLLVPSDQTLSSAYYASLFALFGGGNVHIALGSTGPAAVPSLVFEISGIEVARELSTGGWIFGASTPVGPGTSGSIEALTEVLRGAISGYVGLMAPSSPTSYILTFPSNAGAADNVLRTDGYGVTSWVSPIANEAFGSFWGLEISQLQTGAVQNTWYFVDSAAIGGGEVSNVTSNAGGKLTITNTGRYLINWSLTLEANANNKHLLGGVGVNGSVAGYGQAHTESVTNQEVCLAGTCIIPLNAGDYVQLAFRTTDTGAPNINIDDVGMTITRLGAVDPITKYLTDNSSVLLTDNVGNQLTEVS